MPGLEVDVRPESGMLVSNHAPHVVFFAGRHKIGDGVRPGNKMKIKINPLAPLFTFFFPYGRKLRPGMSNVVLGKLS